MQCNVLKLTETHTEIHQKSREEVEQVGGRVQIVEESATSCASVKKKGMGKQGKVGMAVVGLRDSSRKQ